MTKNVVLCDCMGSQAVDAKGISDASGLTCSRVFTALCMDQIGEAAKAIKDGDTIIACQQERQRFVDLADEIGAEEPGFVDVRDRAGWTDGGNATAKMAALVAEAAIAVPAPKSVDVISEGVCLILGGATVALQAAQDLCDALAVTVLVTDDADAGSDDRRFDVIRGRLRRATGALGGFEVSIDGLQQLVPGGRGAFAFSEPRDGALSQCDIILDLRGDTPLFPAPEKREGYLRADPGSPVAVAAAVLAASQSVGTFEKPLYVRLQEPLCAHSRAEQPACSNCLNLCPTGAITSAGEHVAIDPMICAGCGACAAVCPSGAISYDAPSVDTLFQRISVLARTFRKAGGADPRLLVHDGHGAEMIRLTARHGRGLPHDVIPLETDALASFGHAEMLAALAAGFARVEVLIGPKSERDVIETQIALARAIAGSDLIAVIDTSDPDAMSDALYDADAAAAIATPILPMGSRRQVTRLAAKALQPDAKIMDLPDGAPYGAIVVDQGECTLCLSCVSLCPSGALGDNSDLPQLRFQEDACLQCGLCANICPENAITLAPRLNLTETALTEEVLNEEEPFACIECNTLFGVKSTVEKIMEKLAGTHPMFATSDAARMIQMCDNCRIQAQYHSQNNPFAGAERPRVRTTDDYLSKRKDH